MACFVSERAFSKLFGLTDHQRQLIRLLDNVALLHRMPWTFFVARSTVWILCAVAAICGTFAMLIPCICPARRPSQWSAAKCFWVTPSLLTPAAASVAIFLVARDLQRYVCFAIEWTEALDTYAQLIIRFQVDISSCFADAVFEEDVTSVWQMESIDVVDQMLSETTQVITTVESTFQRFTWVWITPLVLSTFTILVDRLEQRRLFSIVFQFILNLPTHAVFVALACVTIVLIDLLTDLKDIVSALVTDPHVSEFTFLCGLASEATNIDVCATLQRCINDANTPRIRVDAARLHLRTTFSHGSTTVGHLRQRSGKRRDRSIQHRCGHCEYINH